MVRPISFNLVPEPHPYYAYEEPQFFQASDPQLQIQTPAYQYDPFVALSNVQIVLQPPYQQPMSADEKRAERLYRNKLAARECRQKKKMLIEGMEEKCLFLEKQNKDLCRENWELRRRLEEIEKKKVE